MIWAVSLLAVAGFVIPGAWAWYMSGRLLAVTTEAEQWRVARLALVASAGVGVAILAVGVVAFVLTGYDWVVLALSWSFALLHLGLLTWVFRRAQRSTGKAKAVP